VNWDSVFKQAAAAAANSLGASWNSVAPVALHSVQVLVDTAAYIELHDDELSAVDRQLLANNQKLAMQNVLIGYEEIGIAAAEQAVAAAWNIISAALQTAISVA
jgi:hypothetical protein